MYPNNNVASTSTTTTTFPMKLILLHTCGEAHLLAVPSVSGIAVDVRAAFLAPKRAAFACREHGIGNGSWVIFQCLHACVDLKLPISIKRCHFIVSNKLLAQTEKKRTICQPIG